MFTQSEYDVTKQRNRTLYAKIELLNFSFQKVDEWQNLVTGTPSFTNDSNSDIRRTCNISLIPIDKSFSNNDNAMWLDKYIQIYLGIEDIHTKEIIYTNMGIYLINNPKTVYSATQNTVSINGVDLMARMTGMRYGQIGLADYMIKAGANVAEAIKAVLAEGGFKKYVVDECPYDVPNDIRIGVGKNLYDILKALIDIDPTFEMYFDVDGVFHYQKIPSGNNEQIMVDDDLWKNVLISYEQNTPFDNLKNSIEVYGKTHDIQNFGDTALLNMETKTYSLNMSWLDSLRPNLKIGFVSPKKNINGEKYLKINNFDAYPIIDNGSYPNFESDTYYVAKLIYGVDKWHCEKKSYDQTAKVAVLVNDIFMINDQSISEYVNDLTYTFTTPNIGSNFVYNPKIQINALDAIPIFENMTLENNTTYQIIFKQDSENPNQRYYSFMGEITPRGVAEETNEQSPFYVGSKIGKLHIVLSGGEYDNISTSDMAQQRAEYELYNRCRLQDSISLTCVPIYWLDTNWLIEITLPNKQGKEEKALYLIKSINTSFGTNGNQTINCMRYYPNFQKQELYSVVINKSDGTPTQTLTVEKGTTITLPILEDTDTMEFVTWQDSKGNYGNKFTIDKDTIITAIWTPIIINYTVTINPNNGEESYVLEYQENTYVDIETPTYEGYNFLRWVDEQGHEVETPFTLTKNMNLTAQWEKAIVYCTVTFNPNGGNVSGSRWKTVVQGEQYGDFPYAYKTNYALVGWFDENDIEVEETDIVNQNITLTAKWVDAVECTVVYNPMGGDMGGSSTVVTKYKDTHFGWMPTPTKQYYEFVGWYDADDNLITSKTIVQGNTNLYAHWYGDVISITFDVGIGGKIQPNPKEYPRNATWGSIKDNVPTATHTRKTFVEWTLDGENAISDDYVFESDTTIVAKWESDMISFDLKNAKFNYSVDVTNVAPSGAITHKTVSKTIVDYIYLGDSSPVQQMALYTTKGAKTTKLCYIEKASNPATSTAYCRTLILSNKPFYIDYTVSDRDFVIQGRYNSTYDIYMDNRLTELYKPDYYDTNLSYTISTNIPDVYMVTDKICNSSSDYELFVKYLTEEVGLDLSQNNPPVEEEEN